MHGYEMETETLIKEYQARQDYGSMMGCLIKPALYVLQSLNAKTSNGHGKNGDSGGKNGTHINGRLSSDDDEPTPSDGLSLKIDKNLVPVDLRLHSYLSELSRICPCPCVVGSRDLTIADLSADSLEDLHQASKQHRGFDCGGGTGNSTLKKLILGLIHPSKDEDSSSGSGAANAKSKNKDEKKG